MPYPPRTATRTRNMLLLWLAGAAGATDAVSYLELGRVFTANMTGNTVLLGLALVQVESQAALRSALALAGFLLGGALGACIVERGESGGIWPPAVTVALTLEWLLLAAFTADWLVVSGRPPTSAATAGLIALSALAMGVQSAAARRLDVSGVATTYITGTLTNLVARLVRRMHRAGVPDPAQLAEPAHGAGLLAAVWLVYLGGAAAAAAATRLDRALAVVLPTSLVAMVIVTAALCFRKR